MSTQKGIQKTIDLGEGRQITLETGKLAKQADGSVVVRMGDTMLLATVVAKSEIKEGQSFLPLSVDYQEKYAAAGRFPGGFFKREARPSEHEILISRMVDRALRPMFPDYYQAETQVLISLISAGKDTLPDALAGLAASTALTVSDIPFNGPISEVRIARIDGQFEINPGMTAQESADIDLIVAGTLENIIMVEGETKEVSEADLLEAIKEAHGAIKTQCQTQLDLAAEVEKSKTKREYPPQPADDELKEDMHKALYQNYMMWPPNASTTSTSARKASARCWNSILKASMKRCWKKKATWSRHILETSKRRPSVTSCSTPRNAWMVASPTKYGTSGQK